MREAEARLRLQTMTAHDQDPTLTSAEIDLLLADAKRADSVGRAPTDVSWAPTYDLNAAAAEGWRWKAGKAAHRFDASTDGQSMHRSQIAAACERMARHYAGKVITTISIPGSLTVR